MEALVYKSTGSWYVVKNNEGQFFNARIKGKFKIGNITSTNPIAVGDIVEVEIENALERSVVIDKIKDRKNYITRQSPHNKNQHHIIASNVDQSFLIATIKNPRTSLGFIDRFLVTAEAYHIPTIIIFNKSDLYDQHDHEKFEQIRYMYEHIGYKVLSISITEKIGLEELRQYLKNRTTLLSGHSGVGKSSFINTLYPGKLLKTQDVSDWSGKGLHTTTFAEMFDIPYGGKLIDTPGLREFALMDIPKHDLAHYFPEMKMKINDCKFNDCTHNNEPGCAVKEAVENEKISLERYNSYLNIMGSMPQK